MKKGWNVILVAVIVLQAVLWALVVKQEVIYLGDEVWTVYHGLSNRYGWPVKEYRGIWSVNWAALLFNLVLYGGLTVGILAVGRRLSAGWRKWLVWSYALPSVCCCVLIFWRLGGALTGAIFLWYFLTQILFVLALVMSLVWRFDPAAAAEKGP